MVILLDEAEVGHGRLCSFGLFSTYHVWLLPVCCSVPSGLFLGCVCRSSSGERDIPALRGHFFGPFGFFLGIPVILVFFAQVSSAVPCGASGVTGLHLC